MAYQYKIIISGHTLYKEFSLIPDAGQVRIGTTSKCEFRLNKTVLFGDIELYLERGEGWRLTCSEGLYIKKDDVKKLFFSKLSHGDELTLCYAGSDEIAFQFRFLIDFEAEIPHYDWIVDLRAGEQLTISHKRGADIELTGEFGRNTEVILELQKQGPCLTEKYSQYGTYVNGEKINHTCVLRNYDFISIADFSAYYRDEKLYFSHQNVSTNRIQKRFIKDFHTETYPCFIRNTRVKRQIEMEPIKILDPPAVPQKPESNLIISLLPLLAMIALVYVSSTMMKQSGSSFMVFSVASMGIGALTTIFSIFDRKKKYRRECAKRIQKYQEYIEQKRRDIEQARLDELERLRERYYHTAQDMEHIEEFSPVLFDRTPEDEDFLEIYLGQGSINAKRKIDYKPQEKMELGDAVCRLPEQLSEEYKQIANAPVVLPLKEANAVGIVGHAEDRYEMMKVILLDLIARHFYGEVQVYILEDRLHRFDWMELLPHLNTTDQFRNLVADQDSRSLIFESLYKEFANFEEEDKRGTYRVIFVMDDYGIQSHPISRYIEQAAKRNTVFLFFKEEKALLPLYCRYLIEIRDHENAVLYKSEDGATQTAFRFQGVSDTEFARLVHVLAPVYCEEISLAGALRKQLSLFEMLHIYGVDDLDLQQRWEQANISQTMSAPLGINAKNEIVDLDLHEKFHGPHGLVAGTTGSGKSEILQTYMLSMATLYHPYEVGFVIIDFKGGGMAGQFKDLPHLIGTITNIDGKEIDRSLQSIKAELLKRQSLFSDVQVNHIDKYIQAYKEGKAVVPLPHLIIIVDEFAELKAEQPEFMKELISAARIGRSLGVHLILATQKPAGQVNEQIWSNSKFKLCLKVQTKEDSNEVLKSPLAAEIREPGRAYLQVGNNEIFELFQSGYSGCAQNEETGKERSFDIHRVTHTGQRQVIYRQTQKKETVSKTQLEAVVEYVGTYCKDHGIQVLPPICLPPLETVLPYPSNIRAGAESDLSLPIGVFDDPGHQRQETIELPIGSENTLLIGSAQTGKTNFLMVLIRGLAQMYSPNEVNIYIIDFASMILKNFEGLAHVGGVVCPSEDEKLKNLFKYLTDQIMERREKLLSIGVSSFSSYLEAGKTDLPRIILLIDNYTALQELYLQDNDVLLNLCREGLSVGISIVVANSQTSGLSYKYMANFASKLCFFCNDTNEYHNLFASCRLQPAEVPGRCLLEIERAVYECQTYVGFDGEKEIERAKQMRTWIESCNQHYPNRRARQIPEIPPILTEVLLAEVAKPKDSMLHPMGIGYETVLPEYLNMARNNILSLIGPEGSGKTNFVRYWIRSMQEKADCRLYVFDNYKKRLRTVADEKTNYYIGAEQAIPVFQMLNQYLEEQYSLLIEGKDTSEEWRLIVINDEDTMIALSEDYESFETFKKIVGKYKMLRVFILLNGIPDAQIVYGAPEIWRYVKEYRSILYFDNLDELKAVEVPYSLVRTYKKRIEPGDAYYLLGNDAIKIKTPCVKA